MRFSAGWDLIFVTITRSHSDTIIEHNAGKWSTFFKEDIKRIINKHKKDTMILCMIKTCS